ncbi:unnamed protein product [Urochloa humidicola]
MQQHQEEEERRIGIIGAWPMLYPSIAPIWWCQHQNYSLAGPASETKRAYDDFAKSALQEEDKDDIRIEGEFDYDKGASFIMGNNDFRSSKGLVILLLGNDPYLRGNRARDLWETLARVWVRLLVYAAPYGTVEAHMRSLPQSKGGEFITHMWALLYHLQEYIFCILVLF